MDAIQTTLLAQLHAAATNKLAAAVAIAAPKGTTHFQPVHGLLARDLRLLLDAAKAAGGALPECHAIFVKALEGVRDEQTIGVNPADVLALTTVAGAPPANTPAAAGAAAGSPAAAPVAGATPTTPTPAPAG